MIGHGMQTKMIGRMLRNFPLTARALTEYRVRSLVREPEFADLAHCIRLAEAGTTAVDVGASVGNYALAIRNAVGPRGRLVALEPNPDVYRELVCSTWGAGIETRNAAASNSTGTIDLLIPVDANGQAMEPVASLEDRGQRCVRVQVPRLRLDDLLRDAARVSLIKIDVEGHELPVLEGALEVLEKHRPALVVEIEAQHLGGRPGMEKVVSFLADRGYSCHAIHGPMLIPWADFDVDRWQTSYLAASDVFRTERRADYVNNFLFEYRA